MGLRAQRPRPVSGSNALIGQTAITLGVLDPKGQVRVWGEIWSAVSLSQKIEAHEKVIIKDIKELTLYVAIEKIEC